MPHQKPTWISECNVMLREFKASTLSYDAFARKEGKNVDTIKRMLAIARFPPHIQQKLLDKNWPFYSAYLLTRFITRGEKSVGNKAKLDYSEVDKILDEVPIVGRSEIVSILQSRYNDLKNRKILCQIRDLLEQSSLTLSGLFRLDIDGSLQVLDEAVREEAGPLLDELDLARNQIKNLQIALREKQTATILQQLATLRKNTGQFAELCYAISENRDLMTPDQALEFQESISYFSITVKRVLMLFQGEVEISIG